MLRRLSPFVIAFVAACAGGRGAEAPRTPPLPPSPPIIAPVASAAPAVPELLEALSRTEDRRERITILGQIGESLGAGGLVRALDLVVSEPPETTWFELNTIFKQLGAIADPRTGDGLLRWVEAAPRHPHWKGEVGVRLAEIGDLRAAKYLAERMRLEPAQVYKAERFWEADEGGHLSRSDLPRVVAARMLADLATLHPEAKAELLAAAEGALMSWATDRPQPHPNALRFLAAAGSTKVVPDLRAWAFPKDPLPAPGAMPPFPAAFETAQTALRYIGLLKDEPSFERLLAQLKRKPDRKLVITQQGLQQGQIAMLGMALRAVGYGAVQGLGQWGDARAVKPLVELIEDETWNEEVRLAACEALAWCADDRAIAEVVQRTVKLAPSMAPAKQLIAECYASTVEIRGARAAVPALVALLEAGSTTESVRAIIARAIGAAGVDAASEARLFAKLQEPASRKAAAIALILGGSKDTAARAVAAYSAFGQAAVDELADDYFRAFNSWSDAALERGALFRWVENAEASAAPWPRRQLAAQLENLRFDNGPRSLTRVVARYRLWQIAKGGEPAQRRGAVATLAMMNERGTLAALAAEPGETGELARARLGEH